MPRVSKFNLIGVSESERSVHALKSGTGSYLRDNGLPLNLIHPPKVVSQACYDDDNDITISRVRVDLT